MKKNLLPIIVVGAFAASFLAGIFPRGNKNTFDVESFASLPAVNGGRLKPLDSIARNALLLIHGKQTVETPNGRLSAAEWLMQMFWKPAEADQLAVIQIDNPDVLGLIGLQLSMERSHSFESLKPFLKEISEQARRADDVKPEQRTAYQSAIVALGQKLSLYHRLQNTLEPSGIDGTEHFYQTAFAELHAGLTAHIKNPQQDQPSEKLSTYVSTFDHLDQLAEFRPIPDPKAPAELNQWMTVGQAVVTSIPFNQIWPGVLNYAALGDAYRAGDATAFHQTAQKWSMEWHQMDIKASGRMAQELSFNRLQPFMKAMAMYVGVFLLAVLSWLVPVPVDGKKKNWPASLAQSAFALLIAAFAIHTLGLATRIYLQGRPPVTNLYSSAIFVGWAAVGFGIVLEKIFKKGLGAAVAAAIGFITLIIAHHLTQQGDTMEMMRAVLDSNFWLATHVVCITIGYSSTFVAGALAILYLMRERFDARWTPATAHTLERMVYGVVCFSTFFSFFGTILGGIWADQSWGRFWGWDPKENGALMIVLWNALVLHARWGRLVTSRGLMALAVAGNIVTSLSWFGVNMLGIGLHSYGFMQKAFIWLMAFVATQLAIIGLALWPQKTLRPRTDKV